MLVIYDADGVDSSDGPKPLATRSYYARLTQAMITAMTAPMAQGKLYDIDMRLRPSGNQGPVATSLASFESYQKEQAWVWEHLALTRARVIAGAEDLGRDVEALRAEILSRAAPRDKVLGEVAKMRQRIAAARSPAGPLDAKTGAGRLQDIELFAQAGALIGGTGAREIDAGLAAARGENVIDGQAEAALSSAYTNAWTLNCAARLLSANPIDARTMGQAGASFLCRVLACDDLAALEAKMQGDYATAAQIIDAALPEPGQEGA
jgi:glutamate-ammonia-ligase adenylyltransferase